MGSHQHQVKIHGGVLLVGDEAEVTNMTLDVTTEDPSRTNEGRVWYNSEIDRVKYTKINSNNDIENKTIAELEDILSLFTIKAFNKSASALLFGQPVYNVDGDGVSPACANNIDIRNVFGIVYSDVILPGEEGTIQFKNEIVGTISEWAAVTGDSFGLLPGSNYFLSTTTGLLTRIPPSQTGEHFCFVGKAITNTKLFIDIQRPIAL